MQQSALDGLVIADFSRILAGPLATMVLADLGAEVVKIERPGSGDDTRGWGPPWTADGTATYFLAINRNKTSVAADLGTPEGLAEARAVVARSGIVVENFRPGVMDALGLGYDELRRNRPDLIYCSITAFGTGPGAKLPGYDLIVQAMGGLMSVTGDPGGEPQKVGVALVDVVSGLFAAIGILAAVRHRERTGEGQRVEVTLLGSLLAALVNQSAAFTAAGVVGHRMGNEHPSVAPYELLPTADGAIAIAAGNDRQFVALCEVLGLAAEPRFATNGERVRNRPALRAALSGALASRSTAEWEAVLTAARVPAGGVNDIGAAFALAQRLGLSPTVELSAAGQDPVALPASPIRLSATPATYRTAPPVLPDATA